VRAIASVEGQRVQPGGETPLYGGTSAATHGPRSVSIHTATPSGSRALATDLSSGLPVQCHAVLTCQRLDASRMANPLL
jgi:hypothetical protein